MRTLKILHAADLHLDSAFEALGAAKAALRRSEQREMLRRIFAIADERKVDLVLLAGDVFDYAPVAYAETVSELRKVLDACRAQVFVSPGNHDSYRAASPWANSFGENVHIFKSETTQCVELTELGARVYGCAFTDAVASAPLRGFHAEKTESVYSIGVFHGDTRSPDSRYGAITAADIEGSGLNYLALGHVHNATPLQKTGGTYWCYPGCPEGRGFDECGEKGVYYVELASGECRAEFIPTCTRKYEVLEVDASQEILPQLPANTENDVYRLVLCGECERAPEVQALEMQLAPRFFALQIKDKTRPVQDIWERAAEDSLRGLFLRRMKDALDRAEDEAQREKIIQAVRWTLAALDGGEAVEEV